MLCKVPRRSVKVGLHADPPEVPEVASSGEEVEAGDAGFDECGVVAASGVGDRLSSAPFVCVLHQHRLRTDSFEL